MLRVLLIIMLIWCVSAEGVVYFADGGDHVINNVINDYIVVDYDEPALGTHVEVVTGGWVVGGAEIYGTSLLTIRDGTVDGVHSEGQSKVEIYGGTILSIVAHIDSIVEMSGGEIIQGFVVRDNSSAFISGGVFGLGVHVYSDGEAAISGGAIGGQLYLYNRGLIILEGSNFEVNGESVGYSEFASTYAIPYTDSGGHPFLGGTITGLLSSGDNLDIPFSLYYDGDITFVPEPATILLLAFGGLLLRRKS